MLLTTLYLRLILVYHCLPPAIAIDRLRCWTGYTPIKDFRSCADAMGSIPYNKPDSPFFHHFPSRRLSVPTIASLSSNDHRKVRLLSLIMRS